MFCLFSKARLNKRAFPFIQTQNGQVLAYRLAESDKKAVFIGKNVRLIKKVQYVGK